MALDLTEPAQITRAINDTVKISNELMALRVKLLEFDVERSTNDWAGVLTPLGGGAYPSGDFATTPRQLNDASFAVASVNTAIEAVLVNARTAIDALRLSMGVLTGTG